MVTKWGSILIWGFSPLPYHFSIIHDFIVNKFFISPGFKEVFIERMLYFGDCCAFVDAWLSFTLGLLRYHILYPSTPHSKLLGLDK